MNLRKTQTTVTARLNYFPHSGTRDKNIIQHVKVYILLMPLSGGRESSFASKSNELPRVVANAVPRSLILAKRLSKSKNQAPNLGKSLTSISEKSPHFGLSTNQVDNFFIMRLVCINFL